MITGQQRRNTKMLSDAFILVIKVEKALVLGAKIEKFTVCEKSMRQPKGKL